MSFKYYANVNSMDFWYSWIRIRILYCPAKQNTLTRGGSGLDFPEDQAHLYGH